MRGWTASTHLRCCSHLPWINFEHAQCGDVASGIATLTKARSSGGVFEFVGPEAYTMEDLAAYVCNAIQKEPKVIKLPGQLLQ